MQAQHRLRKNSQFQYVYKKGKGSGVKEISLIYVPASGKKRVGFAVGKKIANSGKVKVFSILFLVLSAVCARIRYTTGSSSDCPTTP